MGIKKLLKKDQSTEEKIKSAAKKLFTQKGFDATRTRDIAEEAGINLALLNYYFRSKEKLFGIVMRENASLFLSGVLSNIKDHPEMSFEEKLEFLVEGYIDMLLQNPDLPLFILTASRNGTLGDLEGQSDPMFEGMKQLRAMFFNDINGLIQSGRIKPIHPLHIIANLMSMIVFPFAAMGLLKARTGISDEEFKRLMMERKKLIPGWFAVMFMNDK